MKDPAFLFYSKDFYEGTRMMLPEERACYLDLMIYQHQNGYIPDDMKRLRQYCSGVDEATLQATLQAKFKRCDKGWYNERLQQVIEKRDEYAQKQSENGIVGQFWKRAKNTLATKKEYDSLKKAIKNIPKEELVNLIKSDESETFEAMLQGLLKRALSNKAIANANVIENIDENKTGKEGVQGEKTWRTDFNVYLGSLRTAFNRLSNDPVFLAEQQKYYPGMNIRLSLEKACVNFWATDAGWKHKRRSQSDEIDWKRTLTNALSQPQNKVYDRNYPTAARETEKRESRKSLELEALRFLTGSSGEESD